ncbi:hypothetical protein BH23CHL9_BH23CHL9_13140 [soil metagenome]|jgi:hypothetical protein
MADDDGAGATLADRMPCLNAVGDFVIVESPAQATKIGRPQGPGYFATVSDVEG